MQEHWPNAHGKHIAARFLLFHALILLLAACVGLPAQTGPTGDVVRIENPAARPAAEGLNGAAYFTILNGGARCGIFPYSCWLVC